MNNFYCYNPTKILFGRGMIARIGLEMQDASRVLVLHGGGSIRRNGVYYQLREVLGTIPCVEFGGIEPNPEYETCLEAVALARRHGVDFIVAAGGGSVIDAAKFVALAFHHEGDDPWRLVTRELPPPARVLPFGCIQTAPGSGSEMNAAFVLSRRSSCSKLSFQDIRLYPRFGVLDPDAMLTLSTRQLALGMVDIFVHVIEQYATFPAAAPLQDRQAEAVLKTVAETARPLLARPGDYDLRATIMWCGAQALNGLLSRGVPGDWATHAIGHELTALYGLPHAQTLAIVLGGMLRHRLAAKKEKLAQFGRRIWELAGSDEAVAAASIERTEDFFERLGVPTRFSAVGLDGEAVACAVRARFAQQSSFQNLGEHRDIDLDAVEAILRSRA